MLKSPRLKVQPVYTFDFNLNNFENVLAYEVLFYDEDVNTEELLHKGINERSVDEMLVKKLFELGKEVKLDRLAINLCPGSILNFDLNLFKSLRRLGVRFIEITEREELDKDKTYELFVKTQRIFEATGIEFWLDDVNFERLKKLRDFIFFCDCITCLKFTLDELRKACTCVEQSKEFFNLISDLFVFEAVDKVVVENVENKTELLDVFECFAVLKKYHPLLGCLIQGFVCAEPAILC